MLRGNNAQLSKCKGTSGTLGLRAHGVEVEVQPHGIGKPLRQRCSALLTIYGSPSISECCPKKAYFGHLWCMKGKYTSLTTN